MNQSLDVISRELPNFTFPIMKPYLIQILLLLMASTMFAELTATWTDVVIHTDQPGVEIVSSLDGEALSKLSLTVGKNTFHVPAGELKRHLVPHLHTIRLGHHGNLSERFILSLECGRQSSFPGSPKPYRVYFLFEKGKFQSAEKTRLPLPTGVQ